MFDTTGGPELFSEFLMRGAGLQRPLLVVSIEAKSIYIHGTGMNM